MTRERLQDLGLILLIVLALAGLVLHSTGLLQPLEGLVIRITAPLQGAMSLLATKIGEAAETVRDLRNLRQQNEELQTENDRLLLENVRLHEIQHELALLRDLLNFRQTNPSFKVQGAHVIGRDPSNLQSYVILDIGQEKGIERNMPVVTDRGLVGRIYEVGQGWSRVLLIIDSSSFINALTQSTRANGLVQGQVDGTLAMLNIPQGEIVSVGDTVFTSGLGGNFPRQILIGQITDVERQDYELYQEATVQPTVDFRHLEAVLVITDFAAIEAEEGEG
jgi:rod shape-determining protein MreC